MPSAGRACFPPPPFPAPVAGLAGGWGGAGRDGLNWTGGGRREWACCLPQVSPGVGKLGGTRPDSWKSEEQSLADEECNSPRRCGVSLMKGTEVGSADIQEAQVQDMQEYFGVNWQ